MIKANSIFFYGFQKLKSFIRDFISCSGLKMAFCSARHSQDSGPEKNLDLGSVNSSHFADYSHLKIHFDWQEEDLPHAYLYSNWEAAYFD
jgi:hypothetical protein